MGGERIIEMTWRCSGCKRQNLGRYKTCQTCGNPKDASEEFEMPANTALAPTVTDPALLQLATAGPDWRCRFCGGDQRRADQTCTNCGAPAYATPLGPPRMAVQAPGRKAISAWWVLLWVLGFTYTGCWGLVWYGKQPYTASVSSATWEHVIDVERYALRTQEGFKEAIPADALDVKRIGQRVHHQDKVLTGYETQSFVDTKPDGTRVETYSVREVCGEDCTTEPERCREVCRSNQNGFATCREECSGGRRRCRPRYCSGTRTREVPQTRSEVVKIRVPTYRDEPRYADAFSYKAWSWAHDRTVREQGVIGVIGDDVEAGGGKLRWPAGARTSGLPPGEQEREKRTARYLVTLVYSGDSMIRFEVKSPEALARFTPDSKHTLRIEYGQYLVNASAVTPLNTR
jgi:hypothetical protein